MMNHEKRQKKTEVRNPQEVSIKQNHLSLEVTADDNDDSCSGDGDTDAGDGGDGGGEMRVSRPLLNGI